MLYPRSSPCEGGKVPRCESCWLLQDSQEFFKLLLSMLEKRLQGSRSQVSNTGIRGFVSRMGHGQWQLQRLLSRSTIPQRCAIPFGACASAPSLHEHCKDCV